MNYQVIELKVDYLPQIIEINRLTRAGSWHAGQFQDELDLENTIKLGIIKARPPHRLAGFIMARLITRENPLLEHFPAELITHPLEMEILLIATHPKDQRKGLAEQLLQAAIRSAQGETDIFLEVRSTNHKAIAFYEKHNFIKVGQRRNYYGNPVGDALVMKLERKEIK